MNEVERDFVRARRRRRRRVQAAAIFVFVAAGIAGVAALFEAGVSRIDVVIAPPAAVRTAVVTITDGVGIVRESAIWALRGPLTLQIAADGFVTKSLAVTADRKRRRVEVVLRERPAALHATTEPRDAKARWFLDGAFVREGPSLETGLPPGDHTLEVRHLHHAPASRTVTVRRGETRAVTLPLEPVKGRITVTSEPDAARVTRNGEPVGTTPLALDVRGGTHELRVVRDGYETRVETLRITHHAPTAERHYRLARAQAGVSFTLSPEHGVLSVNGRAVSAPDNLRLAAGVSHRVRYTRPGYAPLETAFTLQTGERRTIALALVPTFGVVNVRSEPAADIAVNGQPAGRTPKRLELPTVPQTIRLTRAGYREVTRTLTPEPDAEQGIRVTLKTEARVRLETAPARYANSVGVTLKLFKDSGVVTLGTPRGEPGRRANEFRREVRLTRAFYAGIHEVTVGQYRRFTHPGQPPVVNRLPVTGIGWEDAARFCNWLSRKEGLAPVYQFTGDRHAGSRPAADGYRLPTEAEWEWLARKAGRRRQTRFPWGDDVVVPAGSGNLADESARGKVPLYIPQYNDGAARLADTGTFTANAAGLHDLAGNASEWTHDVYELRPPPEGRVETDPMDTGSGSRHTVKGSSWRSGDLGELRAAWRTGSRAPKPDLGFRIVRYLGGES